MQIYVSLQEEATHSPEPICSPLELAPTFEYLGLLISSGLSWSGHINNRICSRAKRILGLLYRCFYRQSNEQMLHQLYLSLVRPHLEYAAPVWSPYLHKNINMLERSSRAKIWDSSYNELLERLHLPTPAQRRLHLSLCFMYRTIHGLLYFPPNIINIVPSGTSSHYARSYSLHQPFTRTDSYLHSSYLILCYTGTHCQSML